MRIGYDLKDKPCLFLLTLVYTKKNPIHVLQTKKREMITCQILTLSLRESDENGPTIDIYIKYYPTNFMPKKDSSRPRPRL